MVRRKAREILIKFILREKATNFDEFSSFFINVRYNTKVLRYSYHWPIREYSTHVFHNRSLSYNLYFVPSKNFFNIGRTREFPRRCRKTIHERFSVAKSNRKNLEFHFRKFSRAEMNSQVLGN